MVGIGWGVDTIINGLLFRKKKFSPSLGLRSRNPSFKNILQLHFIILFKCTSTDGQGTPEVSNQVLSNQWFCGVWIWFFRASPCVDR